MFVCFASSGVCLRISTSLGTDHTDRALSRRASCSGRALRTCQSSRFPSRVLLRRGSSTAAVLGSALSTGQSFRPSAAGRLGERRGRSRALVRFRRALPAAAGPSVGLARRPAGVLERGPCWVLEAEAPASASESVQEQLWGRGALRKGEKGLE